MARQYIVSPSPLAAHDPGGGRAPRPAWRSTRWWRSCWASSTATLTLRREGRFAHRALQRGAHPDPLPPPAAHSSRAHAREGGAVLDGKASSRLKVLALLVALMFAALSTRLWFLQVLATQRFDKEARDNSRAHRIHRPLRGQIYDAQGRLLVVNQGSLEVRITPDELGNQAEAVVGRVAKLANVPIADIVSKLQDKRYLAHSGRSRSPSSSPKRSTSTSRSTRPASRASRSNKHRCVPTHTGGSRRTCSAGPA